MNKHKRDKGQALPGKKKESRGANGIRQPDPFTLKLAAVSLGCEKNRIDTEEILGYLSARGFILTDDAAEADVVIVNTCAFIEQAQQESINTLLQTASPRGAGHRLIIAAGCLVEVFGSKLIKMIPEIDGAIGVHSYDSLIRFMRILLAGKRSVIKKPPQRQYRSLSGRILTRPVHSAAVKIAEGCSNLCRYCLIPGIRGPYRSRSPREIITDIENLLALGTREINLIAQDTTAYGSESADWPDLCGLIRQIKQIKQIFWLRIMYTYPSRISDELINLITSDTRICKYLDVPIQHCSDKVLANMGRRYGRRELSALLARLRNRIPGLALRTTCMVGYPGETRREFEELLSFLEMHQFERLGAFRYSPQTHEDAAGQAEQVPQRVSKHRMKELMELQRSISLHKNRALAGARMVILIEKKFKNREGWFYGRTEYQAPEVDGGVFLRSKANLEIGSWVKARIAAASAYNLLAVEPVLLDEFPS